MIAWCDRSRLRVPHGLFLRLRHTVCILIKPCLAVSFENSTVHTSVFIYYRVVKEQKLQLKLKRE